MRTCLCMTDEKLLTCFDAYESRQMMAVLLDESLAFMQSSGLFPADSLQSVDPAVVIALPRLLVWLQCQSTSEIFLRNAIVNNSMNEYSDLKRQFELLDKKDQNDLLLLLCGQTVENEQTAVNNVFVQMCQYADVLARTEPTFSVNLEVLMKLQESDEEIQVKPRRRSLFERMFK